MKATTIKSDSTRIFPAKKNKAVGIVKNGDGSMAVSFANGTSGNLYDKDIMAFVVWTMLNPDCTK